MAKEPNTIEGLLAKYKTVGRILRVKDVALSLKLMAVIFENCEDTKASGVKAIVQCARTLYGLAYTVFEDKGAAMEAISLAINEAQEEYEKLNS